MNASPAQQPTTDPPPLWTDKERAAWRPPERIDAPAWAEKHRYLTRRQSSRPGPWRNSAAPYLIGVMLLCCRVGVEVLTILKASQIGLSEAIRNVIGRWAHLEPDPVLLILPDKDKGKSIVHHRIIPLFEDTPALRALSTGRRWDQKNDELLLANGFTLRLGYSGSISSVASDPARRAVCDERSKFQNDGRVSIADSIEARTSTYDNSIVINLSTPGADPDPTDELFEAATVKLFYFIACPHCGREQRLTFDALEWAPKKRDEPDKNKRAAAIEANASAWLNCVNPRCAELHPEAAGRITDDQRRAAIPHGVWATEDLGWRLYKDGREVGTWPAGGTHVGMHAPAFLSLAHKHRLHKIAQKFVRAEGDPVATAGVYNELFAEVFRPATSLATTSIFERKCRADAESGFVPPRARLLPKWAARLVMTVDTQQDHFYFVVRAYGYGGRSRRIHHGKCTSFEELTDLADEARYAYEDDCLAPARVYMTGIDSGGGKMGLDGSRTDAVYRWCLRDPVRRKPLKGESEPKGDQPIRWRRVTYTPPGGKRSPYEVILWLINSHHHQDILSSDIEARIAGIDLKTGEVVPDAADRWELNDVDDEEFNRHLSNMKKALVRSRGRAVERWIPKTTGARHDYRDCEVYQESMAHGPAQCLALPTEQQLIAMARAPAAPVSSGGVRMPDGRPFMATKRR